jgi:hypothetical protein
MQKQLAASGDGVLASVGQGLAMPDFSLQVFLTISARLLNLTGYRQPNRSKSKNIRNGKIRREFFADVLPQPIFNSICVIKIAPIAILAVARFQQPYF